MKKLIYTLIFILLAALPAAAQRASQAQTPDSTQTTKGHMKKTPEWDPSFKANGSIIVHYDSYDAHKNKVRLSARVYWHDAEDTKKQILLSCHPTVTSNSEVPTGSNPIDGDTQLMCSESGDAYLMVCPDYCGYGSSAHLQHPYLINDITARNCLDALLPAITAARANGVVFQNNPNGNGSDRYELNIVGYSQGGATALACAKLIDGDACPDEIRKYFSLRQTCCGDGPYSIKQTLETYRDWGDPMRPDGGLDLSYPSVLPLIVMAAKEAYNDGCMRTVEIKDFFSQEFLDTGILGDLKSKDLTTSQLNTKIYQAMPRRRAVDILSRNIIHADGTFNTTTKEYKCFNRAMELAELCTGWTPKHPITFFHLPNDDVVPYTNVSKGIFGPNGIGTTCKGKVSMPNIDDVWSDVDGPVVIGNNMDNPDWDTMVHDVGGEYFYVSYMFGYTLREKDHWYQW